jgi:gamma-glutamyltranspeptidase/glutathione hydrolase
MQAKWGIQGMAVAPHSLASESALAVLREGGNALEAMISAAATIAVVYPHMNSIGGDSFWVVHAPGKGVHRLAEPVHKAGTYREEKRVLIRSH